MTFSLVNLFNEIPLCLRPPEIYSYLKTQIQMHIKILILSQEFAETAMNELLGWYGYEARGGQGPRGPLGARTGSPSPGAQPPTSASPNDDAGNCQTPFCPVIVQYGILRIPVFFPRRSISMQFLEYWFLFD